ncbi:hypothetical protein LWI29_011395 [Acer saccharum]|uniref:MDR-like ABC transporter n=1 Tax=Acer saccharum TaxID=4024 RepID=A0AA39W2A8_ACESA|nr:hypothetical protein LWI29_011395 [Acer saccharum]
MQKATTNPQELMQVGAIMEDEEGKKKEEVANKIVPFCKLLSYADGLDWTLMAMGTLGSVVHGMAQPIGYLLLGKALQAFGNNKDNGKEAIVDALLKMGHFLSSFATFFSGVLIAAICCWEVALLTLLVVPLILVIGATYTNKMNTISAAKMLFLSDAASMLEQTITQIKTVFAFVGESTAIKSFSGCMEKQILISKGEALIKGVGTGMLQSVSFCSWALIIWVGAVVVAAKKSNGGDVLAAIMCILFGAIAITHAAPDMQIFNQAMAAGFEIFQVIDRKPIISTNSNGKALGRVDGNIDIRNVFFEYPSRPDKKILQGFSLSIPAGKMVALVGSSGCGKSTVISLVTRFYDPSKGEILVDNNNIKDMDLKFLRKNLAAVSQEPSLFAGTIKDNIRVGNMDADEQQIENAAKMANAHTFISHLPDQYSTEVGQRGVQLSGGQKQRIAIARAILKDPPILLLDEATSALDSESEKLVQEALERAMQGRTVIIIAHRMSTIINADIIAVVENGQVTETGTHQSLLETSIFYNRLYHMQNLDQVHDDSRAAASNVESTSSHQQILNSEGYGSEPNSFRELNESTKQEEVKGKEKTTIIFFRIWFGLKQRELVKLIIGSIAAAFSGISKPVFGYFIITIGVAYYNDDPKIHVAYYSLIFSLIGLFSLFTHILQHYFFGVVGEKAMINLRKALYTGVLQNEIAWFEKQENDAGSLTSRIMNDTSMVKTIISDRMSVIVQCISSILIATIVSMIADWRMALVAWAVMPCHFIGGLIQAKSAKGFSGDSAASHNEFVALTSESAANIRTIASFCHEEHILGKAKVSLEKPKRNCRKASVKYGIIQGFSLCLWNIAHAVALWYTAILIDRNQAKFINGIRAYQIFSLTVPSITELWTLIPMVISAINILTPTFEILDRKTEIEPDVPASSKNRRIKGRIEFQNVKFNYPLRPEVTVLNNFNLQIEPGLRVALVGPSGAGKSSVLALLLRFYDSNEGRILIDRRDIKEYNLRRLRSQIGLVQQEPLLFSSSIRSNICYGNDDASETEIVEASKKANMHEFVSSLPDGYDTVVGEKGCQLSGGQKQRIAIARTLLKNPAILLLDEATSALDAESEGIIVNAMESLYRETSLGSPSRTTQITVAHRLSTVVNSDTIVVMDKGEIVEMGSHSTLVAETEGVYSRLYKLQSFKQN